MTIMMTKFLTSLKSDRRAVTMLEYGLIAALVAIVAITGLTTLGTSLNTQFNNIATKVSNP
jgi:pilus assembly protein Flp/PilA